MNSRTERRLGIAAAAALTVAAFIVPASADRSPNVEVATEIAHDSALIRYAYADTAAAIRDFSHIVRDHR
ncbi:hypothetical protein ATN84_04080 [Paramesorhizobium deserti]|uniref:Uncharacterized protein n=1 Tax=Paramesorhizobium deserti TaxID=1494590 RepID=A0A135I0J5_9HYPH|nr:hypothetical protein [Paramesorhizobium deserti]KXF78943.1 hypothetical protein ATN84_04080 [Paramesorhizobium deserti]